MGVVYKARQRGLDRVVALKMVQFGSFASEQARQRFRVEAMAAARLRHPHIVAIHDVGQLDGQPFFTMDFVEGRNLAAVTSQGPVPVRQAVQDGDFFRARQLLERHRPGGTTSTSSLTSSWDKQTGEQKVQPSQASTEQALSRPDALSLERDRNELATRPYRSNGTDATASPTLSPFSASLPPAMDLRGWEWGYLWRETQGDPHRVLLQLDQPTRPLGVLADGQTIYVGSEDKTLRLLDLASGAERAVLRHPEALRAAAASPDGRQLAVSGFDGTITLLDTASWQEVALLNGHADTVYHLAFSVDGRTLLSASRERLRVWRADTGPESNALNLNSPATTP